MARQRWLTIDETAQRLGVSPITARSAFRRGLITGHRRQQGPWSRIYVDPVSVENYRRARAVPLRVRR
jgi:predicted site-specific integrase-resolvase